MILTILMIIALCAIWYFDTHGLDIQREIEKAKEESINELIQDQNDLHNAAFFARKAMMEEALKHTKQNQITPNKHKN